MNVFLVLLYFVFAIQIIMVILVCAITYKILKSKRKSSTFLTYSLKIFSLYALFTNTIITIPFFNVLINAVYCNSSDPVHINFQCYSGLYLMHMAAAIIAFIIMLFFSMLFNLLYVDLNPNSTIPFASPQSKINLFKMGLKALLPFYVAFDYSVNFKNFIDFLFFNLILGRIDHSVYCHFDYFVYDSAVLQIYDPSLLQQIRLLYFGCVRNHTVLGLLLWCHSLRKFYIKTF